MATYGSADNVVLANRGSNVAGQPATYGIAQPQQYTTTNYTSFNTGEVNPAYHTSYSGYTGTAADHAHTNAPPKITFGQSTTQGTFNNNYRVTAPPATVTSNVNAVPQTRYVQEPRAVSHTSGVRQDVRPVQSSVVNTTYQPAPVASPPPVTTSQTYQQPVAAQPLQTTYHHQPIHTEAKQDNFLCSRCCWIIAAIIGLILLTLALLWGLGVFGGEGEPSGKAPYWKDNGQVVEPNSNVNPRPVGPGPVSPGTITPGAVDPVPHVSSGRVVGPTATAPTVARPTVVQPTASEPHYVAPSAHQPTQYNGNHVQPAAQPVNGNYVAPTVHQPTVSPQPATYNYNNNHNNAGAVQPVAYNPNDVSGNQARVASQPTVAEPVRFQPVSSNSNLNHQQ